MSCVRLAMSVAIIPVAACSETPDRGADWIDPAPHVEGFVEAGDVRLNYLDWGGDGPPVVMVHGAWASPHAFDPLATQLAQDYRVVAYARRGHGKSTVPDQPFDVDDLVRDLENVLDELGLERVHLVAWSFGGYEITHFAVKNPERTDRLVFIEAHYEFAENEPLIPFPASAWEEAPPLAPDAVDLSSVETYLAWYFRTILTDLTRGPDVDAWLRDRLEVLEDGSVRELRPPVVLESLSHIAEGHRREYGQVESPSLALFADRFLAQPRDADLAVSVSAWNEKFSISGQARGKERFEAGLPWVHIKSYPDTYHESVLFKDPRGLANDIRTFFEARLAS